MGLASSGRPSRERPSNLLVRTGNQVQNSTVQYRYRSFFFTHVRHFTPHTQQRQRQMLWSRTRSALGTSHCAPGESITYVLCIEHMSYGITRRCRKPRLVPCCHPRRSRRAAGQSGMSVRSLRGLACRGDDSRDGCALRLWLRYPLDLGLLAHKVQRHSRRGAEKRSVDHTRAAPIPSSVSCRPWRQRALEHHGDRGRLLIVCGLRALRDTRRRLARDWEREGRAPCGKRPLFLGIWRPPSLLSAWWHRR